MGESVNSDSDWQEEGAEDQCLPSADDVGQVAGGDFQDQDRKGIGGLDSKNLGFVQVVGHIVGN